MHPSQKQSVSQRINRRDEVASKLRIISQEMFGMYHIEPTDESVLREVFAMDSLDAVEFFMAVEHEFSIDIPDELAAEMRTFGDAVRIITKLTHQ